MKPLNPAMNARSMQMLAQADLLLLVADLLDQPRRVADRLVPIGLGTQTELLQGAGWSDQPELAQALEQTLAELEAVDLDKRADAYTILFDGAIACPSDESMYVRRDKGAILADICGFHRAFGFKPVAHDHEKPDHIVAEIQFVAVLLAMFSQAIDRGDEPAAQVTQQALVDFTRDHISEWLPLFCDRLEQVANLPLYHHAPRLLRLSWQALMQSHDLPQPDQLAPGPDMADSGTPYECDMADGENAAVDLRVNGSPIAYS